MITPTERELSDQERAELATRVAKARAEARLALARTGAVSGAICGALSLVTMALSDAPAAVILAFWGVLAAVFTLWIGLPWRNLMRGQALILDDARRAGRARAIRIQSARVVEFEEEEDEGACYAFEHGPEASVFIIGQEYYEDEDFPNTDFSIVEILGTSGSPVDAIIVKHGQKLTPERVVPAAVKHGLSLPDHLSVIAAPLDRVEDALRA